MARNCCNFYQHNLGREIWQIMLDNEDVVREEMREKAGIDIA